MNRAQLKLDLKRDEGEKLIPYRCPANCLTIGVGHNIDANDLPPEIRAYLNEVGEITPEMSDQLLDGDIDEIENSLKKFTWWEDLDDARKSALCNMAFNLGMPKLLGFKRMLQALADSDFNEAANQMLNSAWSTQVGARAHRIARAVREG